MIVRIGVSNTAREIEVEMASGTDGAELRSTVDDALAGDSTSLWLTDKDGRQVGVPTEKLAYVDIGAPNVAPKIGFGA